MRILVINGPNLNLLGERDPSTYGDRTLDDICAGMAERASELGVELAFFQSNHEGSLIDTIHDERRRCSGIIINPGALTHYSYSLRDAIESVGLPTVEVHISDIRRREEFRRISVISPVAHRTVMGKGPDGYLEALEELVEHLKNPPRPSAPA